MAHKTNKPLKASTVAHVVAFVIAMSVYLAFILLKARERPEIVKNVVSDPGNTLNALLLSTLVIVGLAIWPVTKWAARRLLGDLHVR